MPQYDDCECSCGCPTCCKHVKYSKCETDEERQERIKASKRQYYQRNKEKHADYHRKYMGRVSRNEQSTVVQSPQLVLNIVTPLNRQSPQQIDVQ